MSNENQVRSSRPDSLELAVYQYGDAVVHEKRTVQLVSGKNRILLEGLPAQFVEDSFEILKVEGAAGFKLGADCFAPADLSVGTLLQKALNSRIVFLEQTAQGVVRHSGKLLQILGSQVLLETAEGVQVLPITPKFELSALPGGLSATPSLSLEPSVKEAGSYTLASIYETGGLSWSCRYSLHYDEKQGKLTGLRCRVKLSNETGADFQDAIFKLLAASNSSRAHAPMRAKGAGRAAAFESAMPMAAGMAPMADSARSESLGEQKLYVLPEALSIANGQTKRPYLYVTQDVPVKAELFLPQGYGYQYRQGSEEDDRKLPVFVRLRFRNESSQQLGIDLPAGEAVVFQPDSSGKYQKTEAGLQLPAVAVGEAFKLELSAPCADVKATRVLRDFQQDPEEAQEETQDESAVEVQAPRMSMAPVMTAAEPASKEKKPVTPRFRTEAREVTVFNFKDKPVQVFVHESLPGVKCEILQRSHELAQDNLSQGTFKVDVPAKGKTTISYSLRWRIN